MTHWDARRYPYQLFYGFGQEERVIAITQTQYEVFMTAHADDWLEFEGGVTIKKKSINRIEPIQLPPERLYERTPQDTNLLEESMALLKADPDPIRYRVFGVEETSPGAWLTFATKKDIRDYLTQKKDGLR